MAPGLRKVVLSAHLTASVGWIGAAVTYLGLGVAAVNSDDDATIRAAWIAMEIAGWYVNVPLAVAALTSGIVMALGTKWGLFRYYWVVISFVLTLLATIVLVLHMPTVSATVDVARESTGPALEALGGDLLHPGVGIVVLIAIQILNIYKPPA